MRFANIDQSKSTIKKAWFPQILDVGVDIKKLPYTSSADPIPDNGRHLVFLYKNDKAISKCDGFYIRNVFYKRKQEKVYVECATDLVHPAWTKRGEPKKQEVLDAMKLLHDEGYLVSNPYQNRICVELDWILENGYSMHPIGIFHVSSPIRECKEFVFRKTVDQMMEDRLNGNSEMEDLFFNYTEVGQVVRKRNRVRVSYRRNKEKSMKKRVVSPTEHMIRLNYDIAGINTNFTYARFLKLCKMLEMNEFEFKELICMPDDIFYAYKNSYYSEGKIVDRVFQCMPRVFKKLMIEMESFVLEKVTGMKSRGMSPVDLKHIAENTKLPDPFVDFHKEVKKINRTIKKAEAQA